MLATTEKAVTYAKLFDVTRRTTQSLFGKDLVVSNGNSDRADYIRTAFNEVWEGEYYNHPSILYYPY